MSLSLYSKILLQDKDDRQFKFEKNEGPFEFGKESSVLKQQYNFCSGTINTFNNISIVNIYMFKAQFHFEDM
jgi:hypothetical protein